MTSEVLSWLQKLTRQQTTYPGLECKNFTTSLADGRVFAALLALVSTRPRQHCSTETEEETLAFINETFDQFLELGVPRLLDAEDLRVKPYPDKLSMATFCIELRRRWDGFVSGKGLAASAATVASSGVAATAQVVAGALIADKENRELNRMLEAAREEIAVLRRDLANATRTHQQAVADWEAKLSAEKKLRSVAGNAGNVELEKKLVEERERREEVVARLTARLSEQAIECDNLSKQIARPRPSAAGGGSFFGAVKWLLTGALLGGGALWYWVFTRTGA